jgi:hypothetical protein
MRPHDETRPRPRTLARRRRRRGRRDAQHPARAQRARRFEIDCRFVVAAKAADARHGVRVEVDGALEWSREAATQNPGDTDSTDYHFRREVPVGRPLRIVVKTSVRGAQRVRLTIEAEEH